MKRILILFVLILLTGCQAKPDTPSARYGAKMIFDPMAKRGILFGGRADEIFGLKYFDDLWYTYWGHIDYNIGVMIAI